MRKLAVLPIAALVLAACTEGPAGPVTGLAPQFIAEHGDINKPTDLTASFAAGATGTNVTISWKWTDEVDSWDLVSFKVTRDGVTVAGTPANAKPYTSGTVLNRSLTDYDVPDGEYLYCVEVMAKYMFTDGPEVTHHESECTTVTVGGGPTYEFVRIAAGNNNTETDAPGPLALSKSGSLVVYAVLYEDGVLVNDCTTVPVASASATVTFTSPGSAASTHAADECAFNGAANRYRYKFTLTNHFNNQVGAGTIDFKVDGATVATYNFTTN